jgi:hypothetical protein
VSTVAKLDGPDGARFQRTSRRNIVRSLERITVRLTGYQQLAATAVLTALLSINNNPHMPGTHKSREFTRIIKELENNT